MKKTDSVIITENGIDVYMSDIDILCDEYISTLANPEMVYTKSGTFTAMLEYIYKHLLHNVIVRKYGANKSSYDFNVLDKLFFDVYIPLCGKYGYTPTIVQFCAFVKIDNSNITDIKNGVYRSDGQKVSGDRTQTVKRWYNAIESALLTKAIDSNGIGSIFALKSIFAYNDSQTIRIESASNESHDSAEQIASRHNSAMIPEKPQLE